MQNENILTLVIAIIAVLISFVSLYRSRKFNEQQILFQQEADKLNRLQRSILEKQIEETGRSDVSCYIYNAAKGQRLGVLNSGNVPVKNVKIDLIPLEGYERPFISGDYDEKIPVKILHPGDEINLLLGLCKDTGTTFTAQIEWQTESGDLNKKEKPITC
jgi:hypothetical protein